ncbi:MAG: exodeoxyribonuclease III [Holosporaceae bacterium]|jgi:exodeoxyribonuclease-3|nr:exodeoxyribonuclease III [Holosporaceae bacterium]
MRIISWNVNSVRARIENIAKVVADYAPDILLLQETRVENSLFPTEYFEDLGYNVAPNGQKGRNGVAICSKYLLEEVKSDFCEEARYTEAFSGGIFVASVYVPNGQEEDAPQYYYKLDFLQKLKNKFLDFKDEFFVVGGDFNVAPYPRDVYTDGYDGIAATSRERELIKALRETGFRDVLEDKGYTWWDYRSRGFSNDRGFRLDHFYLSEKACDTFVDGDVIRSARGAERPSDHAPVLCELKI